MKDELFADLLASAEEMVRIEKGEQTPEPEPVHTFIPIDVKAICEATRLKQQDFAVAVGVSYDLVRSWETKRHQPTGVRSIGHGNAGEKRRSVVGTRVSGLNPPQADAASLVNHA